MSTASDDTASKRHKAPVKTESAGSGTVLAVLLAAPFLAQVDATIMNVATPTIRSGLHASGAAAEWVVGGYLVAFAVLLITGARLGQSHGYRRLFILGVTIFGLTSLAGGLAPDATVLVGMRVLQGAGAALMFPQALTGIQLLFAGTSRTRAIGLFAIALSSGAVLGQILGGVLISADIAGASWRPVLLVNVPVCLAVLAVAMLKLPADQSRAQQRVDLPGVLTLSGSVLLIVVPLTAGQGEGWPVWTWVALAASMPVFAAFLAVERRASTTGRAPLINTSVLAAPVVALGLLALAATSGTYFALLFTLAQYFQAGLGRSALASGLILVPWVTAFGAVGQITHRLPARFVPVLPAAGSLLLTIAYLALAAVHLAGQPGTAELAVLLAVGGLGLGLSFTGLTGHLTNAVDTRYAADISGVSTTASQLGGAVGVAAFGSLYLALAAGRDATTARRGLAVTALALAGAAAASTILAYLSIRPPQRRQSAT